MIAVFIVVGEVGSVIAVKVAAEYSLVTRDITFIGVWFTEAGITTFDSRAVDKLERRPPVAGGSCRPVNALRYANLDLRGYCRDAKCFL